MREQANPVAVCRMRLLFIGYEYVPSRGPGTGSQT